MNGIALEIVMMENTPRPLPLLFKKGYEQSFN